ncbi:MAG: Cell division inhibitor SulA, putative [uncultured Paraburkholderia sp.]|nr:MAG: Cell division inhibitor SulA, putative [uncultured Paraburkholderia sp.]
MWQGKELAEVDTRVVPSGYTALDQVLPGKGWPASSLTELLVEHWGAGELRLLARALCHLTKQAGRHVMLVAPPYQPCAAALKAWGVDVERVLWVRSDEDKALWAATQESTPLAFLMRPVAAAAQSSPAPLRMICEPLLPANAETINRRQWLQDIDLSIDIFKRRGPPLAEPLRLVLPLQDTLLPANGAESGQGLETQHVVDRRRIASLVAGGGKAADLASGWFVREAESV